MIALSAALVASLTASGARISMSRSVTLGDLRCEYQNSPLSIESETPRLSWTTSASGHDWKQSAYRILVASSPKLLGQDSGDLWDSGKVEADTSIQIPYSGKTLSSREACFWKVQVWNAQGVPSVWSKPQMWEMGLLTPEAWASSQWIGAQRNGPEPLPAPMLRKEFLVNGKLKRARLYASGLGYAELHLNGKKLGEATERDPGYTNFDKRVLYVVHNVTSLLKTGPNALGAILGTGWYDVHDRATWNFDKAPWRGRPRLRLALYIDYADGHTDTVVSDPTWKTATGPILFDGIYTGEVYDARKEIPGWTTAGYKDGAWAPSIPMPAPKGVLTGRQCPPVAITETIKAKRILQPKPGVYVVDFGQNIAGHARIKVHEPTGTKITMRYSERIGKDGAIERHEIDVYMTKANPPQPFQTDVYICKGQGQESWEQRFSYSGFQYMEVTGLPTPPTLDMFEARLASTDFESAGSFSCSNELLNKIQSATLYSYLSNAQSIPTDCPQREKNGWTGDAHLAAEAGLMNFKSASFYTKWLDDLADDQKEDGSLSLIVPSGGWGQGAIHPAWNSAYPIIANDLYRYGADTTALKKHYDHIKRYVDLLYSQTQDDVVPFDSLGDWLPWSTETSSQLTSTVCLYADARILSDAAKLRGNMQDADKYATIAERVKSASNRHFFQDDKLETSTQTALSMAIYFNMVDGEKKQRAFTALVANVQKQGHIDVGILGAKFLLRVLSEGGRSDLAYMLVNRKEQPGWGWWISQGATTLWEDWKGESSLNHIMFGDVSNWFYQWIAGIGLDVEVPAFHHILIRPQPVGDLTWAKAEEASPYGRISSSWRRNDKGFHLEIEIPANTTATVRLPGIAHPTNGAKFVGSESGATIYEVGSGAYSFDSQL